MGNTSSSEDEQHHRQREEDEVRIQRGGNRMAQRLRNRRRNQQQAEEGSDEDIVQDNRNTALDQLEAQMNDPDKKLSKKELHKLQKRHEKAKMQEALRQQRDEEQQRRLEQEKKEEEEEEQRELEELERKEEERKKREEEEKKEQDEYNKWKEMFQVEAVGENQEDDEEYENKLQQFIDFIEIRKVVLFEDLAAEFNLQTKDVIDRIQRLQESGRLQGITDDRGKFIHITSQELENVSKYIKMKGRVTKGELLMECNRLVRMVPRAEDREKIKQEQNSLLEKVEKEFVKNEEYQLFNKRGSDFQHQSILLKTDYNKKKPNLKRHYPDQWGRFLDNHYDPEIHHKPFTIAMKAPDNKYKFSQGVGLSYKFNNVQVLEKLEVENQNSDKHKFVRYEEFNQIQDGQVMISIEHCVNCSNHATTTKHDESKYKAFAMNLQGSIREQFPQVQVIVKPITTDQDERVKHWKVDQNKDAMKPTIIDHQKKTTRIGAFEVQLFMMSEGRVVEKILHSKLRTGMWPALTLILAKIHFYLPRIPRITVQLFKDNHLKIDNEDDEQINLKDFEVTLKSTYNSTASQQQLNQYLATCEQERLTMRLLSRHKRLLGQTKQSNGRPQSAKADVFQQVSLFKSQNQFYQRNFQSYTTLPNVRPMSASTYQLSQKSFENILATQQSMNVPPGAMKTISGSIDHRVRPTSAYTAVSKNSSGKRPLSAQSRNKRQGLSTLRKQGRGLGYFGDDNDKIRELENKNQQEKNQRVQESNKKTDDNGKITFQNVPIGFYQIEVQGNALYQSTVKSVNIVDEDHRDEQTIFVGIRQRIDTDIEFSLIQRSHLGNEEYSKLKPEIVEAKAILIPDVIGERISYNEMDLEEYEFDITFDNKKGLWVSTLINGNYLINVKAQGYKELNQYIEVKPGLDNFRLECVPINLDPYPLNVYVIDVQTGRYMKNVLFELWRESSQLPEEGLSDENGSFQFTLRTVGQQMISARKTGYIPMTKKFNFTQGLILTQQEYEITIPMLRENFTNKAYAILTYNKNLQDTAFKTLCNIDLELQHAAYESMQVYEVDVSEMLNYNVNEESPDKQENKAKNPSIRFIASNINQEMQTTKPDLLDRSFKNRLQDLNMQFTIIYKDNHAGNQTIVKTLEAPSFIGKNQTWDICFFCNPNLLETNLMIKNEPQVTMHFSYYQKLSVFLKNRRQHKFNQILGFDSKGIYRMDEPWIDEATLVESMDQLLGDKLWSHDQKKMFQKVQLRKEPEQKLTQINEELISFYKHFARSLKNMFGYVSYKKLQEYIERL